MPQREIINKEDLQKQVDYVQVLTEHHAPHLTGLVQRLADVIWDEADRGSIRRRSGPKRPLGRKVWFRISGRRYDLTYLPDSKQIELVERALGRRVAVFSGNERPRKLDRILQEERRQLLPV